MENRIFFGAKMWASENTRQPQQLTAGGLHSLLHWVILFQTWFFFAAQYTEYKILDPI